MNEAEMLIIEVPASSANLGPGFDSIGLALDLYLHLEVVQADKWEVIPLSEELSIFPADESNFIIRVAMETARKYNRELPFCSIRIKSDIPLARGLGSSAAAIVAGIELADSLCYLELTKHEKLEIAAMMEGHPDNVGASLLGGLVIASQSEDGVSAEAFHALDLEVVVVVPQEELLTKESRGILPEQWSFKEAVQAGSVANVLIASLLSGNYALAGKMMKADLYHHPYRKKIVPHLAVVEEIAPTLGAFGVALSGAGPTILCLTEKDHAAKLVDGLKEKLPEMEYSVLRIDQLGSRVYTKNINLSV